ncbi:MAG: response regulator, partial [Muribaculaceae bacterium]|nr:response regulator [Muribaculaceae bacterium]
DNYSLKGKAIRNIIEVQKGILWMASEDGGINIYNCATQEVSQFNRIPTIGNNIHDILLDRFENTLWIGTFRKGLYAYNTITGKYSIYHPGNSSGLNSDAIFSIKQQNDGTIWIGTTQGLRYYDKKSDAFKNINHSILDDTFIYCVYIDRNDNIWVGTYRQGLFFINAETHEIIEWRSPELKDVYITCIYQDSNDTIWIGTNNSGIQYIHPDEMKIKTPESELSLPSATICGIVEDSQKRLWVSTNNGLYKINNNTISKFTTEDGLPSNQFNFSSAFLSQDSLLYFGSINGLVILNPEQATDEEKPFEVYLKHLNINDIQQTSTTEGSPLTQELNLTDKITLTNEQSKSFNIEYIAISLGNTKSIKYQVRLLGNENSWRDVGEERRFVGSNLPSGTYTLQIRANNTNSDWELAPIKSLKITIEPPFYLSTYAIILYLVLFFTLIVVILKFNNKRIHKKNEEHIANMQKKRLEEFNQLKFEFFTSVSHELKTPLSLILAPLKHITQNNTLGQDVLDKINTVIKSAQKMGNLIDELITFNKVESGIFRFYIQKDNPIEFIKGITNLFKENANERQLSFEFIGENNGELVWYSPLYVESIINNLISNAFKFTPAGGNVLTKASIIEGADGYLYLHIEVTDTGIGIIKEECDNIFNRYYQTKRGHNKNNKGWGLGLALIKNLATIHKGNVAVKSAVGQGSTFIVNLNVSEEAFDAKYKILADKDNITSKESSTSLPQYKYSLPDVTDNTMASPCPTCDKSEKQYTLLIVEDNSNLSQFLYEIFYKNYNVLTAENGKEAIETISNHDIDCIISDIMMPEMDGFELCKYIKSNISTSHVPIVLLSAKNDEKDVLEGMECGADSYIQKPFDPLTLLLQIKNILSNKKALQDKLINSLDSFNKNDNTDKITDNTTQLNKLDQNFIERINNLIEQNINNDSFSIADITSEMGVSRSLLHIKMKTLLNTSASEYIRKKRLNKACELLANGYSVSETAYSIGFADPNYFSKSFKKEFNLTPSEYQNNKRNNK